MKFRMALGALIGSVAWAQVSGDFSVSAVAGSDDTVYAISGSNLFRTSDAGAHWTASYPIAPPGQAQGVLAIVSNPLDPSTVYVGTDLASGGVWKSTDSGVTWTKANAGLPATGAVEQFFAVENQAQTFYVKIGLGLYKTVNAGSLWTLQSTLPAAGTVFTINARTPNLMYLVRPAITTSNISTIFRSTNEGADWSLVGTIPIKPVGVADFGNSVSSIASSPTKPELVFITTRGPYPQTEFSSVHKSSDQGATWSVTRAGGQPQNVRVDMAGAVYWAGPEFSSAASRFERSRTDGLTWEQKVVSPSHGGQPLFSIDLRRPGHMFAGFNAGLYRTTDSGDNWVKLSGLVKGTISGSTALEFQVAPGGMLSQSLAVRFLENTTWSAPFTATVEGAPWLTLSSAGGTTPANIQVRVSAEGLANGEYSARIRLASPATASGEVFLPVSLTVTDAAAPPRSYRLSTVAGGGSSSPSNGGPALSTRFSSIGDAVLDAVGNLVIADPTGARIYRVNKQTGNVETIAGTGTRGFNGDGGPAISAQLRGPEWLAFAPNGDLYFTDDDRIRRIDSLGTINSVGGTRSLLGGLGFDAEGNLYSASFGMLVKRTPSGQEAQFSGTPTIPGQVAVDRQGTVYIAGTSRRQVFRLSQGVGSVFAGTGVDGSSGDGGQATDAQLSDPTGVAVDAEGNVYISDDSKRQIRMVDGAGTIYTIAGTGASTSAGDGGLATLGSFSSSGSLSVDSAGNLLVGDNNRVRKMTLIRPSVKPNGVANAASYTADVAPGSLVAIFGEDLARGVAGATGAPWPTKLAGASVTLNGRLMPLYYVSPGQVNAMVPYETPIGPATLVVQLESVKSASYAVNISAASPGVIAFGENRAVAVNPDGSVNTESNPAKPGSTVVVYMIGLGATDVPVATGAAAPLDVLVRPAAGATVRLGSQTVTPLFLGLTPGSVALAQLNLTLDANLADGDYPIQVTIGGKSSNAPIISVRR